MTAQELHLESLIQRAARETARARPKTRDALLELVPAETRVTEKASRKAAEASLRVGLQFADAGRNGCAAASLLISLALDPERLRRAERSGLLCAKDPLRVSRRGVLEVLAGLERALLLELHPKLPARLATFEAAERLAASVQPLFRKYCTILRGRPPGFIKTLISVVEVAFFARKEEFSFTDLLNQVALRSTQLSEETPETLACIASTCISDITRVGPMMPGEFDAEVAALLGTETFLRFLEHASVRWYVLDYCEQIKFYGFDLEELQSKSGKTFVLHAADERFEKTNRAALIRAEFAAQLQSPLHAVAAPLVSMRSIARLLVSSGRFVERRDIPYRRLAMILPDPNSGAFDGLLNSGPLFEDIAVELDHDWRTPIADYWETPILEQVTLKDIVTGVRPLRLVAELHSAVLNGAADPVEFWNSIPVVVPTSKLVATMLSTALSEQQRMAIVDLLTWDGAAHGDLQYTPIIRDKSHALIALRALSISNLSRNTLSKTRSRPSAAGASFQKSVADALRERFSQVEENVLLATRHRQEGDVDICAVLGATLLIVECKYSLPGASAREHSDALDDVLKGAQQARKCATFIEQMGLEVFAKRRFPKHSAPIERIELVVVTSVRAFSGCEIHGVPIRDWLTFRNVLLDGAIEVATRSGGSLLVRRWSFWQSSDFSLADLFDYLKPEGLFERASNRILSACCLIDVHGCAAHPRLVRRTYVGNLDQDIQPHADELTALGLREIAPEERPLGRMVTEEELRAQDDDANE